VRTTPPTQRAIAVGDTNQMAVRVDGGYNAVTNPDRGERNEEAAQ